MKRKCFVISPIGAEGSDTREHADAVFEYIIEPAMKDRDIEPVRADQLHEPGSISDQMFREIRASDLTIAILTDHNPNVLYELALAQVAGRPVIALLEKKDGNPPFDIKDLRCVRYDLKPRPLFQKVYLNEIIEHVKGLENAGWKVESPFGSAFPVGFGPNQDIAFHPDLQDYGGRESLLAFIEGAQGVIEIMGTSLGVFQDRERFGGILEERARSGCQVKIMILHPDNPLLHERIKEAARQKRDDLIPQEIERMRQLLAQLDKEQENVEMRQMLHGCPHCKVLRNEKAAVYAPYFCSERLDLACLWHCASGSPLYGLLTREFETLWLMNAPV